MAKNDVEKVAKKTISKSKSFVKKINWKKVGTVLSTVGTAIIAITSAVSKGKK